MSIVERYDGDHPFYIVTGSIGPHFAPATFRTKERARRYAKLIVQYGKKHHIWPQFQPWIEGREEDLGILQE